jgi:hypothetical protein
LLIALIGVAVRIYYLARYVMVFVLFSSIVGNHNVSEDPAKNGRGDEATAPAEASGNWGDSDKTVIRLRRADHWFWPITREAIDNIVRPSYCLVAKVSVCAFGFVVTPAKAGIPGSDAAETALDSRLRGSDDGERDLVVAFANLRNELLGRTGDRYRPRPGRYLAAP